MFNISIPTEHARYDESGNRLRGQIHLENDKRVVATIHETPRGEILITSHIPICFVPATQESDQGECEEGDY